MPQKQAAVRTVREVSTVTPPDMVSTVVFNGHVRRQGALDEAVGVWCGVGGG